MQTQTEVLGYIEVPHQRKPCWVYPDYPDLYPPDPEKDDTYYLNDHDNYRTIEIKSLEDLEALSGYDGHQWVKVRGLAKKMLDELS